jgi:hypothetical protein
MSEQPQDTTTGLSTKGTAPKTSENASNTSEVAPMTADEIRKLSNKALDDLATEALSQCGDKTQSGGAPSVYPDHAWYPTYYAALKEKQRRKDQSVSEGGAVMIIHTPALTGRTYRICKGRATSPERLSGGH